MNTKEAEKATIKLTEEAPLRSKKQGGGGNYVREMTDLAAAPAAKALWQVNAA
ncbi:hypothetical protein [Sinobaca sp. H24]|uniref:hypothetical protein n=1 Tax=Sinobaca sp. H24 TaxID=2923376 RepID=UPI0035B00BCB